jgi:hypothetical protein
MAAEQTHIRPGKSKITTLARLLWWGIALLLIVAGLVLLLVVVLPHERLKPALDLLATDGSLEVFNASLHNRLRPAAAVASLALIIPGILWLIKPATSQSLVMHGTERIKRYSPFDEVRSLANSFLQVETKPLALIALGLLFAAGLWLRWLYAARPMQYDEAYTVVAFATRPLWKSIADYHLPNNHVLHTLLVHFSIRWFGFSEWAARLPALLAGALSIPAGYLVARLLYSRSSALLAATWIAFSPVLVDFSANARGYSLLGLLTLVGLGLANYIRQHPNLFAWLLLSLITALGFATLPTMLYPFGMIYGWLVLSWLFGDSGAGYQKYRFPVLLLCSATVAGFLSIVFYTPVLLNSGPQALFANRHVVSLSWYEFSGNLIPKSLSTWQFWTGLWPTALVIAFAGGLLGSVVLHRRIANHKIHLLLPAILWISLALIAQRVTPLPRIWLFLLPPLLILSSAGLAGFGRLILAHRSPAERSGLLATGVLGLSLILINANLQGNRTYQEDQALFGPVYEASQLAPELLEQIRPGEQIAANSPIQAPLRFSLIKLGAPEQIFYNESEPTAFLAAIVVVERGLDLNRELVRLQLEGKLDPASRVSIAETPALIAYRMDRLP